MVAEATAAPVSPAGNGAAQRVAIIGPSIRSLVRNRGDLIDAVTARRHQVLCVSDGCGGDPRFETALPGAMRAHATIGAASGGFWPGRGGRGELARLLGDFAPHVVLAYGPHVVLPSALAAARARVPRIVLLVNRRDESWGDADTGRAAWPVRRALKRGFAVATGFVFHNHDDLAWVRAGGLIKADAPVAVVPGGGVDLQHYAAMPLPPVASGLTFTMIAALEARNGVIDFCKAANMVRQRAPTARFILAGPRPLEPEPRVETALAAAAGDVELRDEADDIRPLLADAHVVVLPSHREGMSRTLMQAASAGRPLIASTIPGCRETIDERVNGVLVPPRDAQALAAAMESYLRRPDLIASMARASRLKAERNFDVAQVNAVLMRQLGLV